MCLNPLEKVPGGWWVVLESHFSVQLKPKPSWTILQTETEPSKSYHNLGESMDPNGMIVLVEYKEVNGEEKPVVMFFKHGLEEEKC